jgi:hypothetical protein
MPAGDPRNRQQTWSGHLTSGGEASVLGVVVSTTEAAGVRPMTGVDHPAPTVVTPGDHCRVQEGDRSDQHHRGHRGQVDQTQRGHQDLQRHTCHLLRDKYRDAIFIVS